MSETLLPVGTTEDGRLVFENSVEPHVIRTSERTTFKKCRRLWDFNSVLRQAREPVKMSSALAFGIAIHVGLQHYYEPERWEFPQDVKVGKAVGEFVKENERQRREYMEARGDLSVEDEQEFKEREELGVAMLKHYCKWAERQDEFTPVAVEERFQVPIPDEDGQPLYIDGRPVVYQVRVDLLLKDKQDRLWILDHKTTARFDQLNFLDVDTQITSYAWAAQLHYQEKIAGVVYNEVRKSAPKEPRVLQSGKLSQDKSQLTTYELYVEAIEQHGLDASDYSGMLDYLREQGDSFVRRTRVHRTQREIAHQGQLILDEARDMLENPSIYPNPGKFNCNYCDFLAPCTVVSEGGDVDYMLNDPMMYREREVDYADTESEDE